MKLQAWTNGILALTAAAVFLSSGCGKIEDKRAAGKGKGAPAAGKKQDKHDDWWCPEHGIPEEECSMCSSKVAKEAKAKGDWCEKHERAKSQCFKCDPSLKEQFAARYRAKYGKEPPEPVE